MKHRGRSEQAGAHDLNTSVLCLAGLTLSPLGSRAVLALTSNIGGCAQSSVWPVVRHQIVLAKGCQESLRACRTQQVQPPLHGVQVVDQLVLINVIIIASKGTTVRSTTLPL